MHDASYGAARHAMHAVDAVRRCTTQAYSAPAASSASWYDAPAAAPAYTPRAQARSPSPIRGAGDRRRAMMQQMTAPQNKTAGSSRPSYSPPPAVRATPRTQLPEASLAVADAAWRAERGREELLRCCQTHEGNAVGPSVQAGSRGL